MFKTTPLLLSLSAIALTTVGCAENNTKPQTQHPGESETVAAVETDAQPIPAWEPRIEPYGMLTQETVAIQLSYLRKIEGESVDPAEAYAIIAGDCTWYCGGEAENVTASSTLPDEGPYRYNANLAHDLRYDTAWAEGVDGPGIGETLTYTFTNNCPRITDFCIHNGYIKDENTWIKNNRVRTLELSINGQPTALLRLSDTRAAQVFDVYNIGIEPIGRRIDGKDLILTFKIIDIYPGTTYDDTAISEIYFDGIDVH